MTSELIKITSKKPQEVKETLEKFITDNCQVFAFIELNQNDNRKKVWQVLFDFVSDQNAFQLHTLCLSAIRILSRDKTDLEQLVTNERICLLLKRANLIEKDEIINNDIVCEALKCLLNIMWNSRDVPALCAKHGCCEEIINRLQTNRLDIALYDVKMLFLITALFEESRSQVSTDGINCLIDMLDLSRYKNAQESMKINVLCEVLKVLFNLTIKFDKDEIDCSKLFHLLKNILITKVQTKSELDNHVINLITNLPESKYALLIKNSNENNMDVVDKLVQILEQNLHNTEYLPPILTVLVKATENSRVIRKYLRKTILPPLRDVHLRPEEGDTVRSKLCSFLTSPTQVLSYLTSNLLFLLCKENVGRMIKYTGYGNCAGLLAQRGLLAGDNGKKNADYSSDSETSDTEEYKQHKHAINPVTGCYEPAKPNPIENMSEEQKEYEAMKLVELIDSLARKGVIQPCKIGEDGKPAPVNHVLELQESLKENQICSKKNDS